MSTIVEQDRGCLLPCDFKLKCWLIIYSDWIKCHPRSIFHAQTNTHIARPPCRYQLACPLVKNVLSGAYEALLSDACSSTALISVPHESATGSAPRCVTPAASSCSGPGLNVLLHEPGHRVVLPMLRRMPWCTAVWCCVPDDHPVQLSELRGRFSACDNANRASRAPVAVFTTSPLLPLAANLRSARARRLRDMHAIVLLGGLGAKQWTEAWMSLVSEWLTCHRDADHNGRDRRHARLLCLLLDASHVSLVEKLLTSLVRLGRERGWVVQPSGLRRSQTPKSTGPQSLTRDTADTSFVAASRRFLFRVLRFQRTQLHT